MCFLDTEGFLFKDFHKLFAYGRIDIEIITCFVLKQWSKFAIIDLVDVYEKCFQKYYKGQENKLPWKLDPQQQNQNSLFCYCTHWLAFHEYLESQQNLENSHNYSQIPAVSEKQPQSFLLDLQKALWKSVSELLRSPWNNKLNVAAMLCRFIVG